MIRQQHVQLGILRRFTLLFSFGFFLTPSVLTAQISGTVFRDLNANGQRDSTSALIYEPYIANVKVYAYNTSNGKDSTTTNTLGFYGFTGLSLPIRIEFAGFQTGDYSAPIGSSSQSSVQFYATATTMAHFGLNYPSDYCQTSPELATPCYILASQTDPIGGLMDVFVSFPSTAGREATYTTTYSDFDNPTTHDISINANQMGPTWGVAYRRASDQLFAATFMKRYSGLGTGGTGAIYAIDPTTNNASVWATLTNGTNAHDTTDWLRDYKTITGEPYVNTWDAVGKLGFGDLDIVEDVSNANNDKVFITNLYDRRLYELNAVSGVVIDSYAMPNITATALHGCPTADVRPFGLGKKQGTLYVGMICSGESTQTWTGNNNGVYDLGEAFKDDNNDNTYDVGERFNDYGVPDRTPLYAYVYTMKNGVWSSAPVLEFPLDFARGCFGSGAYGAAHCDATGYRSARWNPWTSTYKNVAANATPATRFGFPQPILSDIEFDNQGFMYLGFVDRGGHQVGNDQQPDPNSADQGEGQSAGDIMVAAPSGVNSWTIESNGTVSTRTSAGVGNGTGSGGGEFFYQDLFALFNAAGNPIVPNHGEVAIGGLVVLPQSNHVVSTVFDPIPIDEQYHDGGVHFYNRANGDLERAYRVFNGTNTGLLSGKTAGLGDLVALCLPAPIEIGNYVWHDTDKDGIQDANESGINGVKIYLLKNGVKVDSTTTAGNGQYGFSNAASGSAAGFVYGADSLLANSTYEIRIEDFVTQGPLSNFVLTLPNNGGADNQAAFHDSDGILSINNALKTFTTGAAGNNDHRFDFGFTTCDTTLTVANATICNGSTVNLFAQTSGVQGILTYSADGITWTTLSNPTNITPSVSTTFFIKDSLSLYCLDIDTLQITVNQPLTAGVGTNPTATCQEGSGLADINLAGQITGATVGGTWSQTGGTAVGTALNTSTGVFNPNGIAVGTYVFRYTVIGTMPCPNDTEDITITIQNCCQPSICLPVTVTRN